MNRTKVFAGALVVLLSHSATAAERQTAPSAQPQPTVSAKLLPLANGCHDPEYSWWEYSGIQALTCLISGQWPSPPSREP